MSDISKITLPNGIEYDLKDSTARTDLQDKADKATTLSGYGITNAYTKDEVDSLVVSSGSDIFVQKTGDTMTGALTTTELTVGSRASGSTVGTNSTASGYDNTASGNYSFAEGAYSTASESYSHAEGNSTLSSGYASHAEGGYTEATLDQSHAEGFHSAASGPVSHAEGNYTTASGAYSHAEGNTSIASSANSHAEGYGTTASGANSHAEGSGTIAAGGAQHAGGSYNVADNNNTYIEIIGNGTANNARSNARTLDWSGNATYAGKVTAGAAPTNNMDLTTKQYVDNIATTIPSAVSELENDVPYLTNDACDEKTISDNLIHIEDAVNSAANIKIDLSPIQNFNSYDYAWADGCGKNILNQSLYATNSGYTAVTFGQTVGYGTPSVPMKAGTYTFSAVYKNGASSRGYMKKEGDSSNTLLWEVGDNHATFTLTEDTLCSFWVYNSAGIEYENVDVQIESGSSATAYVPYKNISPITGYTDVTVAQAGKNLLPQRTTAGSSNDIQVTPNNDGSFGFSGTFRSGMNSASVWLERGTLPPGTYTVTGCPSGGSTTTYRMRVNKNNYSATDPIIGYEYGDGLTFTITEETFVIIGGLVYRSGLGDTIDGQITFRPMIRLASDADATFEKYIGNTYEVEIPTAAGTIYGGTIDVSDDGSEILTVTKGYWKPTLSTDTGTMSQSANGNRCGYALDFTISANTADILCSCGTPDTNVNNSNNANWAIGHCALYKGTQGTSYFRFIFPTTITTAADGLQYLIDNNCEIVYELTNPITYDLTPLQVIKLFNGENNIWTDTNNNIDLTYKTRFTIITPEERNKLNNIPFNAVPNYFGVCSDSEVTRTVTVDNSFTLAEGVMINVFFENASTSNATLNVNNTGAYPIYIYGTQPVSNAITWGWRNGQLVELVFHDSKWYVQNQYFNNAGTTAAGLMTGSHVTKLNSLDPNSTTPIQLTNQDLDDIHPTNTTWYYAGGGNSVTSKPGTWVTSFGMVCFRTAGGYIIQKLWPTSWEFSYSRTWSGTVWSTWVYEGRTATSSEIGLMSTTDKQALDGLSSIELTNEDLNDLHPLKTTFYWSETGNTCTHKPTAITVNSFALICIRTTTAWMLQICIHPTSNRQWRRYYNSQADSWSGWSEITYSWNAARTYAGLMSAADKIKLDDLKASTINVTDTYGVTGTVGATVTIQDLMDAIASKV